MAKTTSRYWNGDEWRWRLKGPLSATIAVIEPAPAQADAEGWTATGSGLFVPAATEKATRELDREE